VKSKVITKRDMKFGEPSKARMGSPGKHRRYKPNGRYHESECKKSIR
jgi:hypothetical protein